MKKPLVLHPFLFAIIPILFLYSHNMNELSIGELPLPLSLAAASSLLLWLLLALILRDRLRAALVASFFWIWFFSCGHLYSLFEAAVELHGAEKPLFLVPYFALLPGGAAFLILRRRDPGRLSSGLNIAALLLLGWHLFTFGAYESKRILADRRLRPPAAIEAAQKTQARPSPDIYYIILDGYARADILKEIYHYDNSDFVSFLTQKGFHVARNSQANYCQTMLSLASSLNLEYLDDVVASVGPDFQGRQALMRMIRFNRLFDFLRKRGYRLVAFPSGYGPTEMNFVEVQKFEVADFTQFQEALLKTTPISFFFSPKPRTVTRRRSVVQRMKSAPLSEGRARRLLYTFDHLPDATQLKPPIFVFAHFVCPHPPFLFDRNGEKPGPKSHFVDWGDGNHFPGTRDEYVRNYREQLLFVNDKMKRVVSQILAKSKEPPVIILQADHGPGSRLDWDSAEKTYAKERLTILLAYYLPGGEKLPTQDDLSPVNIFRLVLNHCFDANLEFLPNESFYSTWRKPYRFTRVTDRVNAGRKKR